MSVGKSTWFTIIFSNVLDHPLSLLSRDNSHFAGPIGGGVDVGRVEWEYIINPTVEQEADVFQIFHLTVARHKSSYKYGWEVEQKRFPEEEQC